MESKFEFKDLMNNILSGLLWEASIVMIVYLVYPETLMMMDWKTIKDFDVVLFTLLIVFAFILGIVLRGFEKPFTCIYRYIFGDAYFLVLEPEIEGKGKNNKIGIFYSIPKFKVILERLDIATCNVIKEKLFNLGILANLSGSTSSKDLNCNFPLTTRKLRNIGIMSERYLIFNKIDGSYLRFKDLKNFFESVSFPLFLTLVLAKWTIFCNVCSCWYFLFVILIFILFILRYDYYMRNYVKDVFRLIFFAKV